MPTITNRVLVRAVRRIPLFSGLSIPQVQRMLSLCTVCTPEAGDIVCEEGAPSEQLHILISGELEVVTGDDVQLATICPVNTAGEMGVLTGERRSATVLASRTSRLLCLQRSNLDHLLRNDTHMAANIYRNTIAVLCARLRSDNERQRIEALEMQHRFEHEDAMPRLFHTRRAHRTRR